MAGGERAGRGGGGHALGPFYGTMGPWGHEPWWAERAGRAARAARAARAGMDWGPLKSAFRRKPAGMKPRDHEAMGAMSHGGHKAS